MIANLCILSPAPQTTIGRSNLKTKEKTYMNSKSTVAKKITYTDTCIHAHSITHMILTY